MTIKKLVNDKPLWDAFLENINAKIVVSQKKLEHETSMEGIYRAQGDLV
jgi:predicted nucleotide-binding protein (sugar kinase/HSP70/actin superfamily)